MSTSRPDPSRLVVLSPNWLGDAVMALPAIADLRRRFPSAHIAVAARASVAPMFELATDVSSVITLRWRGRLLRREGLQDDIAALREGSFDAALLLPNSFASAWLVKQAAIPERWGYARDWRSPLLTRSTPTPRGSLHQGAYYQHLTRSLEVPAGPLEAKLAAKESDVLAVREILADHGHDARRRLVALAPGAAYGTAKRWLPEHFATLVTSLISRQSVSCVLVGGPADASATALVRAGVPSELQPHVIDLAGATTLRQLSGVLTLANVCVSNDSGAMHLAAALGVRVVALFGPTRDHETAPLSRPTRPATVLVNDVWCRPCMLRECPLEHQCMTGLAPSRVEGAVTEALGGASR